MRRLASLATARWQSGHRKQYEPRSSSAQTRTVRASDVSWTSPQLGQFALIVVVYVYWPSKKKHFDDAAESILHDEDKPWR